MIKSLLRAIFLTFGIVVISIPSDAIAIGSSKHPGCASPEQLYQHLFYAVQSNDSIFPDSKTFVDCIPKYPIPVILQKYNALPHHTGTNVLKQFIGQNFIIPATHLPYQADSTNINRHITLLWNVLTRKPDQATSGTLIPLPYPYIVPGGRFREIYYWDSYFTMLGLKADHRYDLMEDMINNFDWLIRTFGFIPNGNRTYYLTRSQPPFFSLMVDLLASVEGDSAYLKYLPELKKEYTFWMNGVKRLSVAHPAFHRVVRLPDGSILNRYWDDRDAPRAESYRQDIATAKEAKRHLINRDNQDVYRNLRAAAESGWDFSSRWLSNVQGKFPLYTIHTTRIIPVDLNCLLYHLEMTLAKACRLKGDTLQAEHYTKKADIRAKTIVALCWNRSKGFFFDYNFTTRRQTNICSLAGVYPLFFNMATKQQAKAVANTIRSRFLFPGGLVTTTNLTSQQWDAPNGWAPLQWIVIEGLRHYHDTILADTCKNRWLRVVRRTYDKTYRINEKYNVMDPNKKGGGGEYPGQDGFGWTNGVYQALSKEK
ncbi:alpha,alpha-trehalase TreF [Microbacter margulisiae]|uniref:Alpha,alpha-trehalase n=1 Tax=Microbacter margulisiae TaxID=1350067 RepID=A0A7W5DPM0_9PORP|nr:alpha,alpha-trehalase TreF [Microbacter margulisiae]MBB3186652.1 alpha,alpha-trehalase [Microbacter margulisiae]